MNSPKYLVILPVLLLIFLKAGGQEIPGFNHNWLFRITQSPMPADKYSTPSQDEYNWTEVDLPHTAHLEPVDSKLKQWQGRCEYRKTFSLPGDAHGKRVWIRFEGAMHTAVVKLNGKEAVTHLGGYLPFSCDLTELLRSDSLNVLDVMLSNLDDPQVPPGKSLADLDFNWYSGLYRGVHLYMTEDVHITEPVISSADKGGGTMIWFDQVSEKSALVNLKVELKNESYSAADVTLLATVLSPAGPEAVKTGLIPMHLEGQTAAGINTSMLVNGPELWSPEHPALYRLRVDVFREGNLIDSQTIPFGIRTFRFSSKQGFTLNGKPLKIRGTNRHQEYPYVGYALSDNAQYRDAWKIREAGFNFVRCSHYPPSPAFLDACDALGIMVMDAIPGWQFFGDSAFRDRSIQNIRDMVRRDRNHPCIILWEASLNESDMNTAFMERAHQAVHEEMPFADVYTCGWKDEAYDVFIPARQHAVPPHYWNRYRKNKPVLIAEYGDWEYYAQNAGFNQAEYANLREEERTSRQRRGDGDTRLLQQAMNFQEAHNDNLNGPAVGDANWLMFDYKRGYAPDIESSGIMDIFRIPKFAYYFYRSQQAYPSSDPAVKPMVYIAPDWQKKMARVYTNCESMNLRAGGEPVKTLTVETSSDNLQRPSYVFRWTGEIRTLEAAAFDHPSDATPVAVFSCAEPGKPVKLVLEADKSGREPVAGVNDLIFIYASVADGNGTLVSGDQPVKFSVEGDATLIGDNPAKAEAGISAVMLKVGNKPGTIVLRAEAEGLSPAMIRLEAE